MPTLFLDFASHKKILALVAGGKTVSVTQIEDHTDEARLLPAIESMLEERKLSLTDLRRIASVTGPGGFMGMRVGLSIANALAWSLKIPIAGIHLSDLWFARLLPLPAASRSEARGRAGEGAVMSGALWLHSTKKDSLFIRGFGELKKEWPEPTLIPFTALKDRSEDFIGELIPEHRSALAMKEVTTKTVEEVLPALLEGLTYGEPPLVPWYGRGI